MRSFIISILFLTGLLTTACPSPCDMKDEEIKAVHNELAPVVQAIENYKKDQNNYPRKLDELVPKHLGKVPATVGGRKFEYIVSSDNKYNIRVNSANGGSYSGSCSYADVEEEWKDLRDK